jgi:hypothetical protein
VQGNISEGVQDHGEGVQQREEREDVHRPGIRREWAVTSFTLRAIRSDSHRMAKELPRAGESGYRVYNKLIFFGKVTYNNFLVNILLDRSV